MKNVKIYVTIVLFAITSVASAQFYVSGTAGYALGMNKKVLGTEMIKAGEAKDLKGSYGEGFVSQLKGGYFFNEKFAVELGFGYLKGSKQQVQHVTVVGVPNVDVKANANAYGASLAVVYKITNNIYARAGLLTKVGGKTEVNGNVKTKLPVALLNPAAPATQLGDLNVDFKTDFHGKLPLGFLGAVGYQYPIAENFSIFAEVEYMGINVERKTSELQKFSANFSGTSLTRDQLLGAISKLPAQNQKQFAALLPLVQDKAEWGKGSLPSKTAPYSSFGFNVGVSYTFGSK